MNLPRRTLPTMLALAAALLLAVDSPAGPPGSPGSPGSGAPDRADELLAFLRIPAVTGHEGAAASFVRSRLAGLAGIESDALGNVAVTLGSGSPRRLVACPLDEPGFVVSRIQEDGYLRLAPSGNAPVGALWEQAHWGQPAFIGGAHGLVPGGVALPSVHLIQGRPVPEAPLRIADAYVDVGAQNAAEVAALGIRLLDPATLVRRPLRLADGLVAGPGARIKGAALALAEAARRIRIGTAGGGTVVFAWTTQGLFDDAGLRYLARQRGPFDEVILLSPRFGWEMKDGRPVPRRLPAPGTDLPAAGKLPEGLPGVKPAHHVDLEPYIDDKLNWGAARVGDLGLPALYPGTPVEAVAPTDVERLASTLLSALGVKDAGPAAAPPLPALLTLPPVPTALGHARAAEILGALIARAGVSGVEGPVREEVLRRLPAWAKPTVDAQGDVTVTFGPSGPGTERVLFVAHLDEVGFRVAEMLPDGRLRLGQRGSLARPVWEAQAAVVHGDRGPVPALFEPRADWATAEKRVLPGDLTVALGVSSSAAAEALGVHVGTMVTLPKEMLRLGSHRVLGRACDDRVGSTALLLALARIDPAKLRRLRRQVTFAWSVREEIGLEGAGFLARTLPRFDRVHAVDTFVSSDSPLESEFLGYARLGHGPVLRARDNAFVASPELVERTRAFARRAGIPIQLGMTGGVTDGAQFTPTGAQVLPFGWPGRYSHSPVEVADLRDVEALARLIVALAAEP